MKDTTSLGLKLRYLPEKNYEALWRNGVTIRYDLGDVIELPAGFSEFYDVGIGTKCSANCPFCYVSANPKGRYFQDICETWEEWMDTFPKDRVINGITITKRPFQIAIGSTSEPTEHPDFCEFLKTVYGTGVIPNYTTNGIILGTPQDPRRLEILDATEKYCMGVAVSFGNKNIRDYAERAIEALLGIDVYVNIHHIISTKESVDEFHKIWKKYSDKIHYHVLLPLVPQGRSIDGIEQGVWEYLEDLITKEDMKNISFGAKFIKNLETSKIKTFLFPEQSYSKNIILDNHKVMITASSFDLKPLETLCLNEKEKSKPCYKVKELDNKKFKPSKI